LELNSVAHEQLQRVKKRTHSPSITDIVRRALALFDLFTEHTSKGGEVVFKHRDGTEEKVRILG
jgi:hypothetical protein